MSEKLTMSNIFELDDSQLIEEFVQGSEQLLASPHLRIEVNGGLSQLLGRNGEPIAIMYLHNQPRTAIVKQNTPFSELIDRQSIERNFVMFGDATRAGFSEYKHYVTPAGYRIWRTEPSILWKKWWPTERFQDKQRFNLDILVNFKHNWYPVQNIIVNAGKFTIKTIAGQLVLNRDEKVLWLAQIMPKNAEIAENIQQLIPTTVAQTPAMVGINPPSTDLAKKIHQKQLEINPDQAWSIIKKLEQKLQTQIKLTREIEDKFTRLQSRATIAEQRLQIAYNYLQKIGVNPRDIYHSKKKIEN